MRPASNRYQHRHQLPSPMKAALFVGDLSFYCTETDLKQLFSVYGKTKRAEIKRGRFGDSLMHGFVELDTVHGAQLAIQNLNTTKFLGRRLRYCSPFALNTVIATDSDRPSLASFALEFTGHIPTRKSPHPVIAKDGLSYMLPSLRLN